MWNAPVFAFCPSALLVNALGLVFYFYWLDSCEFSQRLQPFCCTRFAFDILSRFALFCFCLRHILLRWCFALSLSFSSKTLFYFAMKHFYNCVFDESFCVFPFFSSFSFCWFFVGHPNFTWSFAFDFTFTGGRPTILQFWTFFFFMLS